MPYKLIIIIGAPRSGTNMLRNVLCALDGVGSWPCDEINYIWRHGNIAEQTDEFTPDMATRPVIKYITKQVDKMADLKGLDYIVEKTCANSLRIPFVEQVFPDAHYIFIYRNGLDVIASANLRWAAKLDIPYLLKKVRYVPLLDLPYYSIRYLWSHIYRNISGKKRLAFWGPQIYNEDGILNHKSLNEICALQWVRCVNLAASDLDKMPKDKVNTIKYETFVKSPREELKRICRQIKIDASDESIAHAVAKVSSRSVGKWKEQLKDSEVSVVRPIIESTMRRFDYND